jgi:hypothetical protein
MMTHDEINELKEKNICFICVGDSFLREEISIRGESRECSYCCSAERCYNIGQIAERVQKAFDIHYERTSDEPSSLDQTLMADRESSFDWNREGEPVIDAISAALDISEEIATDIQKILSEEHDDPFSPYETEFGDDTYYMRRTLNDDSWQLGWLRFENDLKTEARFFSQSGFKQLSSIFGGIDKISNRSGAKPVIDCGPGTSLNTIYRARLFTDFDEMAKALARPDKRMGPPPSRLATDGRMNAKGIAVFYGATEPQVTIAEVRPPVGSRVVVARYEIIRPLRLLDLTALAGVEEHGSVFDPTYAERLGRAQFLGSLSDRISRPIMPSDEAFDYLPTQAIADFLANENDPILDGIVFKSTQSPGSGRNVVLFRKASRVEELSLPEDKQIEVYTPYTGEEPDEIIYKVRETFVPIEEQKGQANSDLVSYIDGDKRDPSLRIDLKSLVVHEIMPRYHDTFPARVERQHWPKYTVRG